MERIKEALLRSRREALEAAESNRESSVTKLDGVNITPIDFRQTKVVDVPAETLLKNRIIAGNEEHWCAAAYKVLRSRVLRRMQAENWNTLAITSPTSAEGKSLTAINLAISIAQQSVGTVLLVDIDMRRPALASYFDYSPPKGLSDFLSTNIPLREVLFSPGIDRLVILPAGGVVANSSDLLWSPKMQALINELKARFPDRFILFDLPPLLMGDIAFSFLHHVDCALLVIEDGKSRPEDVTQAVELLKETHFIGTVLNKYKDTKVDRYYKYSYK